MKLRGDWAIFKGELKFETPEGYGTLIMPDGKRDVGEFRDGELDGQGIRYTDTGAILFSGRWASGSLIQPYWLDVSRFPFESQVSVNAEVNQQAASRTPPSEKMASAPERNSQKVEVSKSYASTPERRVALVIGNSAYKVNPLDNPANDAADMAAALRVLGFEVTLLRNATLSQMRAATRRFEESVLGSDVALIYYAGHGIEAKGRNYMIPVSADVQREFELDDQAYNAGQWLDMLEGAKGKNAQRVNIVIPDACRDNSLTRGWRNSARGLGRMDAPSGTVLVYSTAPGKVAADGAAGQRNSPFTKHLLQILQAPNVPIELVLRETRRRVVAETKGEQVPWENSSLIGEFVFRVQR